MKGDLLFDDVGVVCELREVIPWIVWQISFALLAGAPLDDQKSVLSPLGETCSSRSGHVRTSTRGLG